MILTNLKIINRRSKISSIFAVFLLSFLILSVIPAYAINGEILTEVASLEHDTGTGTFNSLVQVDSDTYALAYSGPGNDGFIKTFTIPADGSTITEVASLEHDTTFGIDNSLVQVDSDTYALAYRGADFDGFIKTFTIPADGSTITEVASLEHDAVLGLNNFLVQVDSDTYALAYTSDPNKAFIKTFTIPADGSTITEVASLEHDTTPGTLHSLVQVDSDTYALAYTGTGGDGFIKTFTIPADGSTITEVASLEHDAVQGLNNSLVQVDSDTYALAYEGPGNDGFIKTFTIPADGSTITEVASLEHDTTFGGDNSLVQVDSVTYALAYRGADFDGFIKTFTIPADGSTITEVASLEHDAVEGLDNSLVQVDSDTYALAYSGDTFDGFIKTFTITSSCSPPPSEDWIITESCEISSEIIAPASVMIQDSSVVTINSGGSLTILAGENIIIVSGSGLKLIQGSTLQINS